MSGPELHNGEIEFFFEKSKYFRNIHVDGAVGSLAPGSKFLNMAIFSERTPIPQSVVQQVENGVLGQEITDRRVGKVGVQRDLEANCVMSYESAVALRDWLNQRIVEFEAFRLTNG